ncbi:serine hydrolase domain-containing protein [Altererythrobacter lutimaris]|uniref:Beta-lactamase family protein n=1 Tax=Altererythrobacter lutimaris TaxID=2743979 RepID=A0A850HEV6_9SPHN|nr:serine hydrolase domain-containing protein [Altererythrobacter lutimaris]NVE95656.1 beta-lactamase family protein [Altererythrobacter lutimaris]
MEEVPILKHLKILPLAALATACTNSSDSDGEAEQARLAAIAYNPAPRIAVEGAPLSYASLEQYAKELGIPAAGYALFKDGELIHQEFVGEDIGPDSLFQSASLSKAVAAATIAILAEREGVSLDEDIAPYITSFDLTSVKGYQAPVTLRELLSHTSQSDVGGFAGYPRTDPIPSNVDVIFGSDATNSKPVEFTQEEGKWYYSGGGYQIAQAFAEDVSNKSFGDLAKDLVLDPVGMERSAFIIALDPQAVAPLFPVEGFERSGAVEGGWHNFPELAAAGLWTTAEDYGKFIVAVMEAAGGETNTGLPTSVAKDMLTVVGDTGRSRGYGLGLGILMAEDGTVESFEHHGSNTGYRASFSAFPKDRAVSVVMTNHPDGIQLATESNRGFGANLGYDDPVARTVVRKAMSEKVAQSCLGEFSNQDEPASTINLLQQDGKAVLRNKDGDYGLVHLGDGEFIYPNLGITVTCDHSKIPSRVSLQGSTFLKN